MGDTNYKKVFFDFSLQRTTLTHRERLKSFIEKVFIKEKKDLEEIHFIFCNNKTIRKINKKYLQHDYNTDVITFCLSEQHAPIIADVFISKEQVAKNSIEFHTSLNKELHRVIFHGVLHLCGYGDKSQAEQEGMRRAEDRCLRLYFRQNVPHGTKNPVSRETTE